MNTIRVVGIDIAKSVFQVCVWMVDGSVAWNKKISRQKLLDTLRRLFSSLREDMQALNERATCLDKEIAALSSQQTAYRHLLTIPGVGPLIAAAFISEVDAVQFSSGRE